MRRIAWSCLGMLMLMEFVASATAFAQDYYSQASAAREVHYGRVVEVKPLKQRSDGLALYAVRLQVDESLRTSRLSTELINLYLVCQTPADFPADIPVETLEEGATTAYVDAELKVPKLGASYVVFGLDFDGESLVLAQHSSLFLQEKGRDELPAIRSALSMYYPYY
ncbi:MAG: hypothetical protein RBU37_07095 [Myxococcota bacterium]|nr:hypothetical protein [Myxococcota bacterium]